MRSDIFTVALLLFSTTPSLAAPQPVSDIQIVAREDAVATIQSRSSILDVAKDLWKRKGGGGGGGKGGGGGSSGGTSGGKGGGSTTGSGGTTTSGGSTGYVRFYCFGSPGEVLRGLEVVGFTSLMVFPNQWRGIARLINVIISRFTMRHLP